MGTRYSSSYEEFQRLHQILETPAEELNTLEEWQNCDQVTRDSRLSRVRGEVSERQEGPLAPGYDEYRRLRVLCGFDPVHGALRWRVWTRMPQEGRDSALDQMREGARLRQQQLAEQAAVGLEWGQF